MRIIQFNLQPHFGGGEVYTKFLCRAFDRLDIATTLIHLDKSGFWRDMNLPASTKLRPVANMEAALAQLPSTRNWLLSHGPIPAHFAEPISKHHLLTGIAHMPPQGRPRDRYAHYHCVFGVSAYVVQGLRDINVPVWDTPLYGIADLQRGATQIQTHPLIRQNSSYEWDKRKARDHLLGWLEPLIEPLRRRPLFERRPGITLGIVSRLTPIKQFPNLFGIISPLIAQHPEFNLEIFGAGGYASVRDLRRATRSLGDRVRFWGHQRDVVAVYSQLDYLLTGLPEKEALGLNVIEAQACGIPVLGINAPPFTETVRDGQTGLLYADPRLDQGAGFSKLLGHIKRQPLHIEKNPAVVDHLARFSEEAFADRLTKAIGHIREYL
jgi:glycosyltransferase involved in cell wall biosynthesis